MAILTIRNEQGETIPIPALRGPQGTAGYSAYDIAVQNGFEGNQLDWLDSLVGPQGPQGPAGVWSLGAIDAANETSPPSGKAVYLALQNAGQVKTVNNTLPDANGNISLTITTSYNDLTDKPTLFSGSYNDLTDKPTLFSGDYTDLTNKPTLFSGSYNDLTNKPTVATSISASSTNEEIPTAKAVYDLIQAAIEDAIGGSY